VGTLEERNIKIMRILPSCKTCKGAGFVIIRFKIDAGTAINIITEYHSCSLCHGTGVEPWYRLF